MPSAGCESPCRDLGGLTRVMAGAQSSQHTSISHQSTDPEGATKDPEYGRGAKTAADADPKIHQPFDARGVFYLPLELKLADGDRCAVARHWPLSREPRMKTITL